MSDAAEAMPGQVATASAGALLRAAREATGLHIAALAVSLKVPVRKIEALEADRWDELTDPVFVRALAGSACRALRTDPAPILALLPAPPRARLPASSSLATDFSQRSASPATDWMRPLANPTVLAVLALLVAALLVYFWPGAPVALPSGEATRPLLAKSPPAPFATPGATAPPGTVADAVQVADSGAAPPVATQMTASVAPVEMGQPGARSPSIAQAPADPVAVPIISFKAKDSSWVEVVDARQTVLMRRIVNAGESASAAGELPLAVVIGRADAIEVQVRGQSFDTFARSKDNVARFEVR